MVIKSLLRKRVMSKRSTLSDYLPPEVITKVDQVAEEKQITRDSVIVAVVTEWADNPTLKKVFA